MNPLAQVRSLVSTEKHAITPRQKSIALAVAALSDIAQFALLPLFIEGAASPFQIGLDIVVGVVLVMILGFNWRLAAAFAIELVPGVDMFPTWTAMVLSMPTTEAAPNAPPGAVAPTVTMAQHGEPPTRVQF